MNQTASVKLARILAWMIAVILFLLPFHAFMTVWLSSLVGHYTLLRLWKEFLLVPISLSALYILLRNAGLRRRLLGLGIVKIIAAYLIVLLICGLVGLQRQAVTPKAMWYGLLVDARFMVFFLAVMVAAASSGWLSKRWRTIVAAPAILVAAFAILQYLVLPYDFLKHFGYGSSTISPYETINHNLAHLRVASTLRGANPLGAYLIIPASALGVWFFRDKRRRSSQAILGVGLLMALVFSFSRSAWIGAFLAILSLAWLSLKSAHARKKAGWALAGLLILTLGIGLILRNNLGFENAVLHTDHNSHAALSSNQGHSAAFKSAVKDIVRQPLGDGVGSAGPQSVYSDHTRIAENYYLQIGQEAGVIGMLLFIAISAGLGKMLYERRQDSLALVMLVSLIGISFVNLLSHAWADDTLAYIWWGLAGIALAPAIITDRHKQKDAKKLQKSA